VTPPPESSSSHTGPPSPAELQRLTAIAQHQLNNPLAALLAEAQLLRSEPGLPSEHAESVDRMIDITRRVIALVRDLEQSVRERSER
jgi:signal transduction histidine kinase